MKIAILTSEFITEKNWHGGLANYLSRITQGLVNRGHSVHVFVYSDRQETVQHNGLILHRLYIDERKLVLFNRLTFNLLPSFAQILYTAYVFRREFLKINRHERFDIIHSSNCLTPALFLNAKKIGAPIITRVSGATKKCQIASRRRNKLDIYLINFGEAWLARKSNKVFTPGWLTQKTARKEFKKEVDLMEPPEYFQGKQSMEYFFYDKYLQQKKYLLFYGTFGRLKGSEFIADNIHYFLSEFKDYYFVIIGKMQGVKNRLLPIQPLLENAKEYKKRIIYINSLPHRYLLPVIEHATAIVLPSMIDNLPNTCIESMSQGKIVIGTYEGGFDQLITQGENGFLVHYGDHLALREIFDFICRGDQQKLTAMGAKAQETVRQRLNFENKIRELEQYYETAIKEYRNGNERPSHA